jgi:hypothetical protein
MVDPGTLTFATFAQRIGAGFRIRASDELVVEVTLTEAVALGQAGAAGAKQPFSIVFRGPAEQILPQGIYRVEHEAIGASDIFLVPLMPDGDGARYEAVFT